MLALSTLEFYRRTKGTFLRAPKKMKRMERRSHAHAMDESPVWRISHGQATCQRRTLATHRTALASTQASSLPVPRAQALGLPQGPHRHHLRPQDGHPLGAVAPGDGLWLWHDLPELPQCLAAGRGLGEVAPDPLGRARAGRQARLVPRRGR